MDLRLGRWQDVLVDVATAMREIQATCRAPSLDLGAA